MTKARGVGSLVQPSLSVSDGKGDRGATTEVKLRVPKGKADREVAEQFVDRALRSSISIKGGRPGHVKTHQGKVIGERVWGYVARTATRTAKGP